jgi:hypothetical protein
MDTRPFKKASFTLLAMAVSGVVFAPNAMAETVTVTTLNDVSDFSGSQLVNDLPGPDGRVSFREAVTAANNTAGPQTIAFAIPITEFWLFSDMALLKLEQDAFFLNDSGTTVDFSTQTVNIGDTNPNGPEVGIYGLQANGWGIAAIFMNGDNCVVKGLGGVYQRGYAVRMVGNNNRVIGCQIKGPLNAAVMIGGYVGWPAPTGNIVGGTSPEEGNTLVGLVINGPAESNIVIGNTVTGGVDVQGATQYGAIASNNRIGGPTPAERTVISGAGYYGEEGFPVGSQVRVIDADGTIVEGNYIGTTADGMQRYPQQIGPTGVEVRDSRGTTIRDNLIAGMRVVGTNHYAGQVFGQAVHVNAVNADTEATVIEGNSIGLAADGVTPITTRSGIKVVPLSSNRHAVGTLITSNHIAGVETIGITVGSQENGITITQNSIHDCGGLGIDLYFGFFEGTGGETPNDAGDGDVGGNGLQNFPVLLSAETTASTIELAGTLDTSPSEEFAIEFFSSPSGDPSGFGEGAVFLGSTSVTTDGAGHAAFSLTLPANVAAGHVATATATRVSTGDTSEFSAWIVVASTDSTVLPNSLFVFPGEVTSGDMTSLFASDENKLVGRPGTVMFASQAPLQVTVEGTAPAGTASSLSLVFETSADMVGVGETVEVFNFQTGRYDTLYTGTLTTTDVRRTLSIPNPNAYIGPGNRLRAKLSYRTVGTLFRFPWYARLDEVTWRVAP